MKLQLIALVLMVGLVGCHRKAPSGVALRVQLSAEPASLDPTLAEDGVSLRVLGNTMEGLVAYDGAGKLRNAVAESYSVSPDGRRYEFKLREQARWSDGRPVTAQDFVTGFGRLLAPGSPAKLAGSFFGIAGAREYYSGKSSALSGVRDEGGRLILELKERAPWMIQALTLPAAMPLRADALQGGKWPATAPSNGPYRIVSHEHDRRILLERNPHYWGDLSAAPVQVELLILTEEAAALHLFERGGVDILTKLSASDLKHLPKERLHVDPFVATFYLSFDLRKPPFSDRQWRRAVAGAVRREEVVRALDLGDTPARSWVPLGIEGHVDYTDPATVFAPALAALKGKGAQLPVLQAAYDSSSRNTLIMEKVQADLKRALGLKLSLINMDWKTYLKAVQTDPPPIFRLGILSPFLDPIQILESFTTGNPNNYVKWSNPRYDELVAEIGRLAPGAERAAKVHAAQAILVDQEAVVVPLYHYAQNHAVSTRVREFKVNPFSVIHFDELRVGP